MITYSKKMASVFLCLILLLTCSFFANIKVDACGNYIVWDNHAKLIDGVGSYGDHVRYYWIDSSASGETSLISQARYDWVNTTELTTSILIRQIGTQSSSVFDIYKNQRYPYASEIQGVALFYNTSNELMGDPTYDYKWTQIVLVTQNYNEATESEKLGIISHEFGHCFGLAHTPNATNRIMYPYTNGREVNSPGLWDLLTINHLYG